MIEVLRTSAEQITIISLFTNILLIFTCLIVFIVFMKSIMLMIRVTYIITIIAETTRKAIKDNLPQVETYIECQPVSKEAPIQIIRYTDPPFLPFAKRYTHGILKAIEIRTLVQIASLNHCWIQVLPHIGDYINEGDPIVKVYGANELHPQQVLKAFSVEPEREIDQDPAYGIRMLVDIALQSLSSGGGTPSTVHQVLLSLTNLLAMIAQRPEHTGAFADHDYQIRLLYPMTTWNEFVELAFKEIIHYGKNDPQTLQSLSTSLDYLLEVVPETYQPPLKHQKALLTQFQRQDG